MLLDRVGDPGQRGQRRAEACAFPAHPAEPVCQPVAGLGGLDRVLVEVAQRQPDQIGLAGCQMLQVEVVPAALLFVRQVLWVLAPRVERVLDGGPQLRRAGRLAAAHLVQSSDVERAEDGLRVAQLFPAPFW